MKTSSASRPRLLRPLSPVRRRTEEVVERIAAQIQAGRLPVGAKLPTEQEMMAAMGVSRTVVREAISALRARGLVMTRQGAGAFVSADSDTRPYMINPEGLGSLSSVVEVLELRTAVEIEAAAIASERATATQIRAIAKALSVFSRAISRGDRAVKEDFDFHLSIAVATGNPRFTGFLDFLGGLIIPRQSIWTFEGKPEQLQIYLKQVETEHEAVLEAIRARTPDKAREVMRFHLVSGQERYRQLVEAEAG
ncbi:FadR/GntR family transcriptional regulator [Afipia sp. Root123D2]|uniref:FadR/GntR family transcriptional regulator n=1 Tax=Afipia sp. Root123D2 TaxID=1736436 RepID=UPI000B2CF2BE|nr:FadR/GntR family transcriptional regulator [Afipia sp. Root123D2]